MRILPYQWVFVGKVDEWRAAPHPGPMSLQHTASERQERQRLPSEPPSGAYLKVPFVDLTASHANHRAQFHAALDAVLDADSLILGSHLKKFETEFAALAGTSFAIGVSNGADAIELILRAMQLQPSDQVIVPANSFFASASAVSMAGAQPIFCDVGEDALISLESVQGAVTDQTRAIIAVHLYGQCVDMEPLCHWANHHNIDVIEDAAQAHGASYHGKSAGSLGRAAAFSFYPTKNLGALGDAGAVTSNDSELMSRVQLLRNYGSKEKYKHTIVGRNCRMDSLQAAFLSIKATRLREEIKLRQAVAKRFDVGLFGMPLAPIRCERPAESAYHLYVIQLEHHQQRDSFRAHLAAHGIQTSIHYPISIHQQPAYATQREEHFPTAEKLSRSIVSLPMYPTITADQIDHVIACVRSFWS